MTGELIGVGVGPGDPELLTLKALRIIKEADVIAVPGEIAEESIAYQIVYGAWEGIQEKELLAVPMPMTKDKEQLRINHEKGAQLLENLLDQGKKVAFLTLGDPTIYSTYLYVHKILTEKGYDTRIVSGIPSFCAVSARLNTGLVETSQQLHVLPASYQIQEGLKLPGTKVLMKAGHKMKEVKQQIQELGEEAVMIRNCGMEDEEVFESVQQIPDDPGYYSLIIVKEKA